MNTKTITKNLLNILLAETLIIFYIFFFNYEEFVYELNITTTWIKYSFRFLAFPIIPLALTLWLATSTANFFATIISHSILLKEERLTRQEDLSRQVNSIRNLILKNNQNQDLNIIKKLIIELVTDKEDFIGNIEKQIVRPKEFNNRDRALHELLYTKLKDLGLSLRALNALNSYEVAYLKDLVVLSEKKILDIRNFGKESLKEIKEILDANDLSFEMDLSKWVQKEINLFKN